MAAQQVFAVDLDKDVRAVSEMVANLKPYIYEKELFGAMPGNLPRLTLGGLIMRLERLSRLANLLQPAQLTALESAKTELAGVKHEWAVAYATKLTQELRSRISSVNQFLLECDENPSNCTAGYPSAMEKRVIVEVLKDEAERLSLWDDDFRGTLANVDNRIHRRADPVDTFIWEPRVQPAYPSDKFWFLYLLPPRTTR